MDAWVLGPLVLQKSVLLIAVAILAGFAVMKLRLRRESDLDNKSYDRAFEALLIWLFTWKLSVLLLDPQSVIESPLSLLYFSGGEQGTWIAAAVAGGYVWLRDHKSPRWPLYIDSWLVSLLVGYMVYRFFKILFEEVNIATNGLLLSLSAVIVILLWKGRVKEGRKKLQQLFLVFVLGHAVISVVASNTWEKAGLGSDLAFAEAGVATGTRVGERAPDFELEALGGGQIKLSDYRGKKVLINFWATWCPPCRVEMPHMQRFYSEYKDRDVVILSVNATQTEASKAVVNAYVNQWGLTFPIVLDSLGDVGKIYKVAAYPATYLVDEQGIIRKKVQGPMNEDSLKKAVR
ncbi:redoxin domain-containing protein [Paenibacillus radicis (ex Xue et al. 2023)]|uniref:Redoxin domain-containing protein n=1 Tax=Paenibacillus radicis (ex Xue et al. 2023) TaxID=2972489 RepID=A0ABT1YT90_9BACL|nr:redoxin domain-containing protein [Paenibacillus radicis (ex Xue et al. 2023)]MCR8636396.1 redoxin domain-containing protein [Paenibacillus radicis (ex Xue et al. 2023)]